MQANLKHKLELTTGHCLHALDGKENLHKGYLHLWEERASLWVSEQHPLQSQAATSYSPFQKLVKFCTERCSTFTFTSMGAGSFRTPNSDNQKHYPEKTVPCAKVAAVPSGVWLQWGKQWRAKGGFCHTPQCSSKGDLLWGHMTSTKATGNRGGGGIHLRMGYENYVVQPTKNLWVKSFSTHPQILRLN